MCEADAYFLSGGMGSADYGILFETEPDKDK